MFRSNAEVLLACTPANAEPAERAALGALLNAVRRDAPSVDVRDVRVDGLDPADEIGGGPQPKVAVPLVLHAGSDVAESLDYAARSDSTLRVTPALGPDWILAEVGVQRLIEAGARRDDTIVLGVAGSVDDKAIADFSKAARLLSAVWGGRVHVGSIGGKDTPITDAVDIARAYNNRVVVSSYLLTPGRFADMLQVCGADVVTQPLLDGRIPDARLVSLVVSRFHQAIDDVVVAHDTRFAG